MSQFSMNLDSLIGAGDPWMNSEKNRLTPSKSACSSNSLQVTTALCSHSIIKYTDRMFAFQMVFIFLIERMSQDFKVAAVNKSQ